MTTLGSQGRLWAALDVTVRRRKQRVHTKTFFHEKGLPRAPSNGGLRHGHRHTGGEVKLHLGVPGVFLVWGKPHSSKTVFLQALANVTKVTYCSF